MATATATKPTALSVPDKVVQALIDGDRFAQMLPACYRESATRWINRGKLYMLTCKQSDKLLKCTSQSLVRAFLQAAEQGIPVDGKLGYLVPYGDQATFMASYVGLLAVARRHALITDGYARLVRERDHFDLSMIDGVWRCEFRPFIGTDPGVVIGAFAVLLFPGKRSNVEFMNVEEIEAVRRRSKAANNGPWVTDWGEMAKKTVIRRVIKTYVDDPEVLALLDSDDRDHGIIDGEASEPPQKIGARKAAPLRLEASEPVSEPPHEDRREPEPPEAPEFVDRFLGCRNDTERNDVLKDLMADDPTMEMQYVAARDWAKANQAKGGA